MTKQFMLAASALALAACGQTTTSSTETTPPPVAEAPMAPVQSMSDAEFVQAATTAGAFEIESSRLAAQRAQLQSVKDYASQMITQHTAANQELANLAPGLGLSAPQPSFDAGMQAKLDSLGEQSGEAFDDAYLDAQVAAHEDAVRTFQTYLNAAPAGPLRQWAERTLPTLQRHLTDVRALENAS